MKRESITFFLLFAGLGSGAYAHAGMADRMLETMVSVGTLILVIFITQLLCILTLRRSKREQIIKLKWKLLMLAKKLCGGWWRNTISGWVLSTFVLSTYLASLFCCLSFWGVIPFFAFWIYYWLIILNEKRRIRWMTRLRAIHTCIIFSIGQIAVCTVFLFVDWIPWLQVLFDMDGFFCLADGAILCTFFLAIPFVILMLGRIVKCLMHKAE